MWIFTVSTVKTLDTLIIILFNAPSGVVKGALIKGFFKDEIAQSKSPYARCSTSDNYSLGRVHSTVLTPVCPPSPPPPSPFLPLLIFQLPDSISQVRYDLNTLLPFILMDG